MDADNVASLYTQAGDEFTVVLWGLAKLVALAMLLERALYFVFDYSLWREALEGKHVRAPIAFGVSLVVCAYYDFDVLYLLLDPLAGPSPLGIAVTATIVAGGSAAAIHLFQDVLKFSRSAREESKAMTKTKQDAERQSIDAEARKAEAEAEVAEANAQLAKRRLKDAE